MDFAAGTVRCNCSICRKSRNWLAAVGPGDFRLLSGEAELSRYEFGRHTIHHRFCRRCGLHPFSHKSDQSFYAVNIACLDDADTAELIAAPVVYVDGLHDDFQNPPSETRHL
jgi:hypothetical protein